MKTREVITRRALVIMAGPKSASPAYKVDVMEIIDEATNTKTIYRAAGSPPPKHARPLVVGAMKR